MWRRCCQALVISIIIILAFFSFRGCQRLRHRMRVTASYVHMKGLLIFFRTYDRLPHTVEEYVIGYREERGLSVTPSVIERGVNFFEGRYTFEWMTDGCVSDVDRLVTVRDERLKGIEEELNEYLLLRLPPEYIERLKNAD